MKKILILLSLLTSFSYCFGQNINNADGKAGFTSYEVAPLVLSVPQKYVCTTVDSLVPNVVSFRLMIKTDGSLGDLSYLPNSKKIYSFSKIGPIIAKEYRKIDLNPFYNYIEGIKFSPAKVQGKSVPATNYYINFQLVEKQDSGVNKCYKLKFYKKYIIDSDK